MQNSKIYIVGANLDESIKRFMPTYDVTLFKTFTDLEDYIESTPDLIFSLIVTEDVLPFSNSSMQRLMNCLGNQFLEITGKTVYIISPATNKKTVRDYIEMTSRSDLVVYQGVITDKFIVGIVNGSLRDIDEDETEEVIYRYRADEYTAEEKIKRYESSDDNHFTTDDELLAGIPDIAEPIVFIPETEPILREFRVVGKAGFARTVFAFLEAQFLSLNGKTVIVESDCKYHRLTDLVMKSELDYEFLEIGDFAGNMPKILEKIINTQKKLIVVGTTKLIDYSYDFIVNLLEDTLDTTVSNFVVECDFESAPYNQNYTVVMEDTMPDVLECCQSLVHPVNKEQVAFVAIRQNEWQPYNLDSTVLSDIIAELLGMDEVIAQSITIPGVILRKKGVTYDLLSVIGRGNRR